MQSLMSDFEDFVDMEAMQFVNPYEVNPIANTTSQPASIPHQVSANPVCIILQKDDIAQKNLKMEEFSDLSAFLLTPVPNVDTTGSTDELTTPVIDRETFDFTPAVKRTETKNDLKVKVEYNAQYYSCDKTIFTDLSLSTDNHVQNKGILDISNVDNEQTDMYLYQPYVHPLTSKEHLNDANSPPSQGFDFHEKMAAFDGLSFTSNLSIQNIIKHSNSTAASPQDDRYSYISSPEGDQHMDISVPERYDHVYDHKPKLNLMTAHFKFPIKEEGSSTLNTPDVIEDVVNMGDDFNILDLVNNEDITIISADEELLSSLTSPSNFASEPSTPSATLSKPSSPVKISRKRKASEDDDDDEDYVPPTKITSTIRLSDIDVENSNSSDDGSYYQPEKSVRKSKPKPRGRPPKRADSVSSDGPKNQNVSKYRELRDKNNEASRKSRQKRKSKETEYEKEYDDLRMQNIRLKAQVEELEKMVTTFRNNLFKILVNK